MKKRLLVFLPKKYYKIKYETIIKRYDDYEITIISREPLNIIGGNISIIYAADFSKMIYEIFKIRNTCFEVFLASNVDDRAFQIIFRYLNFREFHSFDEGQRSLFKSDYFFEEVIPYTRNRRNWFFNKIFGFPLPFMNYFQNSQRHYAFYDPKIFDHALKNHPGLEFEQLPSTSHSISKIFVGTGSSWYTDFQDGLGMVDLREKDYQSILFDAASQINSILPDLYLMHPRENNDLVDLLDDRVTILKNIKGNNDAFINNLASSIPNLHVFVERTGLVFDLEKNIQITFINLFNRFTKQSFHSFVENFQAFRDDKYQNE